MHLATEVHFNNHYIFVDMVRAVTRTYCYTVMIVRGCVEPLVYL